MMGLYEYGYEKPSPVQEEVIPYALAGISNMIDRQKCYCTRKKWYRKNRRVHYSDIR